MGWYAGLDWGNEGHAVCVVDRDGNIAAQIEVTHEAAGLIDKFHSLNKHN